MHKDNDHELEMRYLFGNEEMEEPEEFGYEEDEDHTFEMQHIFGTEEMAEPEDFGYEDMEEFGYEEPEEFGYETDEDHTLEMQNLFGNEEPCSDDFTPVLTGEVKQPDGTEPNMHEFLGMPDDLRRTNGFVPVPTDNEMEDFDDGHDEHLNNDFDDDQMEETPEPDISEYCEIDDDMRGSDDYVPVPTDDEMEDPDEGDDEPPNNDFDHDGMEETPEPHISEYCEVDDDYREFDDYVSVFTDDEPEEGSNEEHGLLPQVLANMELYYDSDDEKLGEEYSTEEQLMYRRIRDKNN